MAKCYAKSENFLLKTHKNLTRVNGKMLSRIVQFFVSRIRFILMTRYYPKSIHINGKVINKFANFFFNF